MWIVVEQVGVSLKKASQVLSAHELKKPTGCLLGACSGRQPVGYRFSLLTLLFSGAIDLTLNPTSARKFRVFL